ncbi:hypothetical protein EGW08_023624, partial [Elysia chlorotica]
MIELIGNTPIIKLKQNSKHNLYAKCEWINPTGSIKDRVAKYIIKDYIKNNILKKSQPIVEASSGNMGTSLAAIGKQLNHPVHITCPEKTGQMKRSMIERFGANLTICKNTVDALDPEFYVNKAKKIANKIDGIVINQYDNPLNTECHYNTTGKEIVDHFVNIGLDIDYFITVGGSGGTVTGCAKRIKETFPNAKVIMPDPHGSVYYDLFYNHKVINENIYGYKVEGPGNNVFCESMDLSYIDEIIQFSDSDAINACKSLAIEQGLYCGHSSGANYFIANQILSRIKDQDDKNIVILLLDSGMKY